MKRVSYATILALILTVLLASYAMAAAPTLTGTWSGTAKKMTETGCSNVTVTLVVAQQCTTLVRGTLTVGTATVTVVGRIEASNLISLEGQEMPGSSVIIVALVGQYSSTPSPRIVVDPFTFINSDITFPDVAYNIFTLVKK